MNFAFVLPNLAGGGAEKAILKLATTLARRGHRCEIVLLEQYAEHPVPAGVAVSSLAARAPHGWLGKRLLARRLHNKLGGEYDLIVSTLPFADEVAMLARLPRHWCRIANTLSSEIRLLAQRDAGKSRRRQARYQRLYGRRPLIAVSNGVADDLSGELGLSSRIEIIPNAFDFAALRTAAAQPLASPPARRYVIHVGRFAPQKRHDLLLDAWARVATDRLLVLLTAADPALDALIRQRGLEDRVQVAGFQPNPYPWIAGADLLVLCSDHEGLPNVLIEALACGTPAVSTDCPSGPREILAAFPEFLVPCGDADALASAITRALAAPPDVREAGLSGYGSDRVADAYERLARER